jgi:hypothetical protein
LFIIYVCIHQKKNFEKNNENKRRHSNRLAKSVLFPLSLFKNINKHINNIENNEKTNKAINTKTDIAKTGRCAAKKTLRIAIQPSSLQAPMGKSNYYYYIYIINSVDGLVTNASASLTSAKATLALVNKPPVTIR